MPITDMEKDEIRMAAKNHVRETREEWMEFRAQGREYLQEPQLDLAALEELQDAQILSEPAQERTVGTIPNQPTAGPTQPEQQQISGIPTA